MSLQLKSHPLSFLFLFLLWLGLVAFTVLLIFWTLFHPTPINLSDPLTVDQHGIAYQGNQIVGRLDHQNHLEIPLITPETAAQSTGLSTVIHFAKPAQTSITPTFVSIQGTQGMTTFWTSPQDLSVSIEQAVPESHTALLLTANPSFFSPTLLESLFQFLTTLTIWQGLGAGIALLLLIILLSYHPLPSLFSDQATPQEQPSIELTPLQLAILHHGRVRPLDLIACFFHLSQRGYLQTINQQTEVVFLRTPKNDGLADYERGLLALLFTDQIHISHLSETLASLDKELFSAIVNQIYIDLYASLESRTLFQENPRITHLRFKTIGIFIQLTGLLFLFLSTLYIYQPFSWLLAWGLCLYLGGVFCYKLGSNSVLLSVQGKAYFKALHSFSAFLTSPLSIDSTLVQSPLLYDYMAYALVLDCADRWITRFQSRIGQTPSWYSSESNALATPAVFMANIYYTANTFSQAVVTSLDPNVD